MATGRTIRRLGLAALAAGALAVTGGVGDAAAAPCDVATIRWDGGAGTVAWGTATNWDLDRVPEATDHVCIETGSGVTFSTGTVTVKSLEARKPFTVSGGTLNLGDHTQPSVLSGGVTVSGGTLTGAAPRTISGTLSWTGGTLAGPGATTVPAATTLSLTGAGTKTLAGPLRNEGTVSVGGTGPLAFNNGGVLTNAATVTLGGDAPLSQPQSDSRIENLGAGTIVKQAGVTTTIEAPVDNDGIVRSNVGSITLTRGTPASTASSGKYLGAADASVVFDGATTVVESGAQVQGAGGAVLRSGTLSGPLTVVNGGRLRWTGGTLRGPASGEIAVASGGTLSAAGTASKLLENRLVNNGTFSVDNATVGVGSGGLITNNAELPVIGSGIIDCCTTGTGQMLLNAATGVIEHTGATASIGAIRMALDNDGVVRSAGGRLDLTRGTGSGTSVGSYQANAGATIGFPSGGTHVFGPKGSLGGPGRVEVNGGTLTGPWVVLASSTVTFMDGALAGPTDGTQARVAASATIEVATTASKSLSGTIRNDGTIRVNGTVSSSSLLLLLNTGTIDVVGASSIGCCDGTGPRVIQNTGNGVIKKTGATDSTATIAVPVDNDGVLRADTGTLTLTGGSGAGRESAGQYAAVLGAGLRIPSGDYVFGSAGSLAGPGIITLDGGNLSGPFRLKYRSHLHHLDGGIFGPNDSRAAIFEPGSKWTVLTTAHKEIGGNIVNQGVLRVEGNLSWHDVGVISNSGIIDLVGSPKLDLWSGNDPRAIVNEPSGSIRKLGVAGSVARVEVPIDNDGTVLVNVGALELTAGTGAGRESTGEYRGNKTLGALTFVSGTHHFGAGGRITGRAPVVLTGNAILSGPVTVKAGAHLRQVDGELWGPASGTPALVEAGGTWSTSTTAAKFATGRVRNEGTVVVNDLLYGFGNLVLENAGLIDIVGAAQFKRWDGSPVISNLAGGTLKKTGVATSTADIDLAVDNDGVVRSESGVLDLTGGSGGRESTGEYSAAAGGPAVNLAGGTHTFGPGGRFAGPGRTALTRSATVTGPFTVAPTGRFVQVQGTLTAPPVGDPPAVIESGGVLSTEGTGSKYLSGGLRNVGTIRYAGSQYFYDQVALVNEATIDFPGSATINVWSGPGPRSIENRPTGTILKTGLESSSSSIDIPLDNDGVIRAESGTLSLDEGSGNGISSGVYRAVAAPTTAVQFGAGTHAVAPGAKVEGPGTVTLAGGTVSGPLTVAPGARLAVTGGTLNAPIDDTGKVLVEAGAELAVSGTSSKWFLGPIDNQGTMRFSGPVSMDTAAQIVNSSLLEMTGGGAITCCTGATSTRRVLNTATGTVRVTAGNNEIRPAFENRGTVLVDGGELYVHTPTDIASGTLGAGTWHTKAKLKFNVAGITANTATIVMEGTQSAVNQRDGLNAFSGLTSNSGSLTLIDRALSAASGSTATFTNTGTLSAGPGGSFSTRLFRQNAGLVDIDATGTVSTTAGFELAGGMLTGPGQVSGTLKNVGGSPPVRLRPGGEMDVTGDYNQTANGVLEVELTGAGAGTVQRQLLGTGQAVLGGKLTVSLDDSFVPVSGARYVLGTFANVQQSFATAQIETITGWTIVPYYTGTEFGIEVTKS